MRAANAIFSQFLSALSQCFEWSIYPLTTPTAAGLALVLISAFFFRSTTSDKIHDVGGIPGLTAWNFFRRRFDFIQGHFKKSGGKMFRFKLLQHRVIAVTGEQARQVFFNDQSLDLMEGYKILMGGAPDVKEINAQSYSYGEDNGRPFVNRILSLLRKDRVVDALPFLLDDIHDRMLDWGSKGKINPFKELYDLVFQMTVRMATCRELAEDKIVVEDITRHYLDIEQNNTPVSLLLPWFPGQAKRAKERATLDLYLLINKYVTMRREAKTPSTDPIDLLIAKGNPNDVVIGTVMAIIFAGVINTGVAACWALLNLGANPKWKERVIKEYNALAANNIDTLSTEPLHKRLASIPLNAWEDELPSVDLVIRETLRLTKSATAVRRNVQKDITVEGVTIKRGDFMAYSMFEVHMNPNIYSNPTSFDPDRYLEGREEDKKEAFAYIGWGVGRHPCAGMKIAKLEIKLILALMLLGYDYELVDKSGKYPDALPVPDRNDIVMPRPLGEPCYLKFERIID